MDFRTKVPIKEDTPKITHASGVFLIGSCFVENIGAKLDWFKFKNLQNPTGIIFHPSAIRQFFQRISDHKKYEKKDVFEFNDGWQSLEAHSVMRRRTEEECLTGLNSALENSRDFLKNSNHVIISLGTSWGYVHESTDEIVANCHKIPQHRFKKKLSSIQQIKNDLQLITDAVCKLNENAKVIYTISPIRHLKDGFQENQQSKAYLIAALHEFLASSHHAAYFPSYEILMDELRDYRFYTEDMLHPNSLAINYIWKLFSKNWMTEETLKLNSDIDKIQKALLHRPREENSVDHKKFLTKLQGKIEEIQRKHSEIRFAKALLLLMLLIF